MRSKRRNEKLKKRKSFILQTLLSVAILIAIVVGTLTGYYGSKVLSFLNEIGENDSSTDSMESIEISKQIENVEPFAALILGTDIDQAGTSRSDTIIVATINPKEESMKMVSIPRDTLITLPNGQFEKMNAAYTVGGASLAQEMIEEKLDIPIEFYATMDFNGLIELVDAVGGITVDSDLAFTEMNHANPSQPIQIEKGIQELDGADALGYARMRKQDPRGDFGRQDRQKEVVEEVLRELVSFNTLSNLTEILNVIQPYLKTNATTNQMLGIASNYRQVLNNIEQHSLNGEARNEYFPHYGLTVYVWEPYEESVEMISSQLREHLELEKSSDTEMAEPNTQPLNNY